MLEDASAFKKQNSLFPAVSAQSCPSHLLESDILCGCAVPVCVTCGVHTVHVWMLSLPWGHFGVCVALAAGSARFGPFKLLRMRKKVGMSPMSFEQCISVTSDSSKWPSRSAGSSHHWLHGSAERGTCASGAFLLVCPTAVMDTPGGCIFLTDKLNLPLVIAWNTACGKLDKLSSCAAVCVYPKVTVRGALLESSIRQWSRIQRVWAFL